MITIRKLEVFKMIKGDIDARISLSKYGMSSADLYEINNLMQGIYLYNGKKLAPGYGRQLLEKADSICDTIETKELLFSLSNIDKEL